MALVGIFDRHNEPVVMQNYLVRYLSNETERRVSMATKAMEGSEEMIRKIEKAGRQEMEDIDMQMAMLGYSMLDIFTEKAQIIPDRVATEEKKRESSQGKESVKEVEPTYLGLLSQSFVDRYEFDVYGYVSVTGFKYLVFKIEQRLNPVNASTQEKQMRLVFEKLQQLHTRMMLNPFFDFDTQGTFVSAAGGTSRAGLGRAVSLMDEEEGLSENSSSSCSSNSSSNDQAMAP